MFAPRRKRMRRGWRPWCATLIATVIVVATACTRTVDSAKSNPSGNDSTTQNGCPACGLELKPVLELGTQKDSLRFTEFGLRVARDSHGRIFVALQSGAFGTLAPRDEKGSAEYPFHRFDGRSGAFQRSMGDSIHVDPDAGTERVVLSIDETQSGNVWTMNPTPLRLAQFDILGKRLREFRYQPSWLPTAEQPAPMLEQIDSVRGKVSFVRQISAQPVTQVRQARVMLAERVAILLGMQPKRGWEKRTNPYRFDSTSVARAAKTDSANSAGARLNQFNGWYDSVVEAVDLTTGKSLGSQTLPFSGNPQLLRGGYLATLDGNTDGSVRVIIWSIGLPNATKPQ